MVVLVLGAIIVMMAWKSSLLPEITVYIILVAFIVLVVLIFLVAILVVLFPKKLVFDQEAHLAVMREKLGDNELPMSYELGFLPNVSATRTIIYRENNQ